MLQASRVERPGDAVEHPPMHRTGHLPKEDDLAPSVSHSKAEKCFVERKVHGPGVLLDVDLVPMCSTLAV